MENQYDEPLDYDYGLGFDYSVWTADTVITMTNVRWDNTYKDTWIPEPGTPTLNDYIDARESANVRIEDLSYAKVNQPINIDIPFNRAFKYNYLRASNPVQPVPGGDIQRDYYYFITDVVNIAPNTTSIVVQLDVWQTFIHDATFGYAFVDRGHAGVANSKKDDNFGRDFLTLPEGLDVGGEYRQVAKRDKIAMNTVGEEEIDILVISTVDIEGDVGEISKPRLRTSKGSTVQRLPSGAAYYVFDSVAHFQQFMNLFSEKPWITQGIISITGIPNLERYGFTKKKLESVTGMDIFELDMSNAQANEYDLFIDWRNSDEIMGDIPDRYATVASKFKTYPYMVVEMTTYTGSPLILKPESWADANCHIVERVALMPPSQRITFLPWKYNANPGSGHESTSEGPRDDNGEYLDMQVSLSNFPTFALVNNMAASFLASNQASNAFVWKSADWSQQKALQGAQTGYDQAGIGMEANRLATAQGISTDAAMTSLANDQANFDGVMSVANTVTGTGAQIGKGGKAGAAGHVAGAAFGVATAAANLQWTKHMNNSQFNVRNQNALGMYDISNSAAGQMRDSNLSYAQFAANGDYHNTIAAQQAKVQDAMLAQPSTSGQVGGDAGNLIYGDSKVSIRWKLLPPAELRSVGEYWLRYGYAVRQFIKMPDNLNLMSNFTYWKVSELYLDVANCPETYRRTLVGIIEKGVTVWSNPDNIGMIDIANNVPKAGFSL